MKEHENKLEKEKQEIREELEREWENNRDKEERRHRDRMEGLREEYEKRERE